jgi:predicted nuclease of predicted toxin-antitoxin system
VRLLLDANLSPEVARRLKVAGHDAVHVVEIGLVTASDPVIMQAAAEADRIILTADSDFAAMLAGGAIVSLTRRHLRVRELPIDRRA